MRQHIFVYTLAVATTLAIFSACKKYPEATPIPHAAYLRVFNDIATNVDFLNSAQASPFLTLVMDPHMDASGSPDTGLIVSDFLATRQLFSLSYPINEGNGVDVANQAVAGSGNGGVVVQQQAVNYEYPGNAHVLTAPALNGFDLSSWAQVPSGRHRFLFVLRPLSDTPFTRLAADIRDRVLIDTTLDLKEGEVYTMEALSTDLDNNRYGVYVRQEQFVHQAFDPNHLYVGFVNLSGVRPLSARYGYFPDFYDTTAIYYSYLIYQDLASTASNPSPTYAPLDGYNNEYFTTLTSRMSTQIDYLALPLLDRSYFFRQDSLKAYAQHIDLSNTIYFSPGTFPYVQFSLYEQDSVAYGGYYRPFTLSCAADPVTFNNLVPGVGASLNFTPNLDLITNVGGLIHIYPTLNIMEMVYDRVYLMQIQNGFNEVPN